MQAARIHRFGGPEVIVIDNLPRPTPDARELLVRVAAAGVGPWDALIREAKSDEQGQFTLGVIDLPIHLHALSSTHRWLGPVRQRR
jgi:NADPH:quinone reductase-like Zn-dependent oxidoreductase